LNSNYLAQPSKISRYEENNDCLPTTFGMLTIFATDDKITIQTSSAGKTWHDSN